MSRERALLDDAIASYGQWVGRRERNAVDDAIDALVAARDAEWRAAVERVRESHPGVLAPAEYSVPEARVWARGAESALKSLLAAMEAK